MSRLTILTDDHPILRKKSIPVQSVDKQLKKFADDMVETMLASDGVGLAAPQVGQNIRMITMLWYSTLTKEPMVLINPVITKFSPQNICMEEGCLSLPGQFADVNRSAEIEVTYKDLKGAKQKLRAKKMNARIIQHEVDHLDGILFIDKAISKVIKYVL